MRIFSFSFSQSFPSVRPEFTRSNGVLTATLSESHPSCNLPRAGRYGAWINNSTKRESVSVVGVGNNAAGLRRVELNLDVGRDIQRLSVACERLIFPEPNRVHRFIL